MRHRAEDRAGGRISRHARNAQNELLALFEPVRVNDPDAGGGEIAHRHRNRSTAAAGRTGDDHPSTDESHPGIAAVFPLVFLSRPVAHRTRQMLKQFTRKLHTLTG